MNCYCGKDNLFKNCCQPFLNNTKKANSAEELMRSRYSAYCMQEADYLIQSTHLSRRKFHKKSDILDWSKGNHWVKLEIIASSENNVEFKAFYLDESLEEQIHHEKSTFVFEEDKWFYVDGIFF